MKPRYSSESGYILVLAIFVIMGLLAVTMLAIDLGNIYMWRVRLERAAKAGISAGLGYRTLKGWQTIYGGNKPLYNGNQLVKPDVRAESELDNLVQQMRATFSATYESNLVPTQSLNPTIIADYDIGEDRATMEVVMRLPTILLGRLTVFGIPMRCNTADDAALCEVRVSQSASLNPASIILLLDTSGSMECEVEQTPQNPINRTSVSDCSCRTSATQPCGTGNKLRLITLLKEAVHTFVRFFNPIRDRIAIVPFNLGANRSVSILDNGDPRSFGADEVRYQSFIDTIGDPEKDKLGDPNLKNGLETYGNTNPCDAFIMAADEIRALSAHSTIDAEVLRPQIVFFTDGAPNALRGVFKQPDGARLDDAKPQQNMANDWYNYSVEWDDDGLYRAPGPLIHSSFKLFNRNIGPDGLPMVAVQATPTPPAPTPTPAPTPARCGDAWYEKPKLQFLGSLNSQITPPTKTRARGCLTGLDFDIPHTDYGVRGVEFANFNSNGVAIPYTNQLPYYCTIEAADYIRQQLRGTIFAVGLGPNPDSCLNADPLQDADNVFIRKDNFLARVALDPMIADLTDRKQCKYNAPTDFQRRREVQVASLCNHSLKDQPFSVGYTPANLSSNPRGPADFPPGTEGEYLGFEDPFRIQIAFARIAKQILFRLND